MKEKMESMMQQQKEHGTKIVELEQHTKDMRSESERTEGERFFEMLLRQKFNQAKAFLEEKVNELWDSDTGIEVYLRHKEHSGRNVAHVLANQIQPELATRIHEAAPFL